MGRDFVPVNARKPPLGALWLAHAGVESVGHAVLSVRYSMEFGGLIGYIHDLYVKPKYRGMGAGSALLAALYAECQSRSCKSVQVEVGDSNTRALALYSQFGLESADDGRILLAGALREAGA